MQELLLSQLIGNVIIFLLNSPLALGLHDYPSVIKKPMDLNTLRVFPIPFNNILQKNLEKNKYKYFEDFFSDLNLIWNNCKTYNVSGSEIYRSAEFMERKSKKLLRDLKIQLNLEIP